MMYTNLFDLESNILKKYPERQTEYERIGESLRQAPSHQREVSVNRPDLVDSIIRNKGSAMAGGAALVAGGLTTCFKLSSVGGVALAALGIGTIATTISVNSLKDQTHRRLARVSNCIDLISSGSSSNREPTNLILGWMYHEIEDISKISNLNSIDQNTYELYQKVLYKFNHSVIEEYLLRRLLLNVYESSEEIKIVKAVVASAYALPEHLKDPKLIIKCFGEDTCKAIRWSSVKDNLAVKAICSKLSDNAQATVIQMLDGQMPIEQLIKMGAYLSATASGAGYLMASTAISASTRAILAGSFGGLLLLGLGVVYASYKIEASLLQKDLAHITKGIDLMFTYYSENLSNLSTLEKMQCVDCLVFLGNRLSERNSTGILRNIFADANVWNEKEKVEKKSYRKAITLFELAPLPNNQLERIQWRMFEDTKLLEARNALGPNSQNRPRLT